MSKNNGKAKKIRFDRRLLCVVLAGAAVILAGACLFKVAYEKSHVLNYSEGLDDNGFYSGIRAADVVDLPEDYGEIPVDGKYFDLSEEEIDEQMDELAEAYGRVVPASERAAEMDDIVNVTYFGQIKETQETFTGANVSNINIHLGAGGYPDGFEEQLVGHDSGDNFKMEVTYAEDYPDSKVAGQVVVFTVNVNSVNKLVFEDEDVAKNFGAEKLMDGTAVTTLDTLREYIKERSGISEVAEDVIDYLVENSTVKDKALEKVTALDRKHSRLQHILIARQKGYEDVDMYLEIVDSPPLDELIDLEEDARIYNAKLALIQQAIAEKEGLSVDSAAMKACFGNDYDSMLEMYGPGCSAQKTLDTLVQEWVFSHLKISN